MLLFVIVIVLILCLVVLSVGFVVMRRVHAERLRVARAKKTAKLAETHPWQRVRTETEPSYVRTQPQQEIPFTPVPEGMQQRVDSPSPPFPFGDGPQTIFPEEGPRTGPVHRLGPVHLETMPSQEFVAKPKLTLPSRTEPRENLDKPLLNDPFLQHTLRRYRQKGEKQDEHA
jgi:hypothetical protein